MQRNDKVEEVIDIEANQKDKDNRKMTSKECVTKSFEALLQIHETDQSASPIKYQVLEQKTRCI